MIKLSRMPIGTRLSLIVAVAVIGVVAASAAGLWILRAQLMAERHDMLTMITDGAVSIAERHQAAAEDGTVDAGEVRAQFLAALRASRYQGDNYFYVIDRTGRMIMHPVDGSLEQRDLSGLKDTNGHLFIAEMLREVSESGTSFVEYDWPRPGSDQPVPKISYAKAVPGLDLVVTTGMYVDDVDAIFWNRAMVLFAVVLVLLAVAAGLSVVIRRSIVGAMTALTSDMQRLSQGDTSVEIHATDAQTEIGAFARALEVFKQNTIERDAAIERERAEEERRAARGKRMEALTKEFDNAIVALLGKVKGSVDHLHGASESLSSAAEQTNSQSSAVAAASEEASANVQTVAAATEELTASVEEIGRQVHKSSQIAADAVDQAGRTSRTIDGLASAAGRIGEVVKLITDIASQTNLLALNATIEAARAGEAGKGFAVVANEVKALANQTSRATEDIAQQIADIQKETENAVEAIRSIGDTISEINAISSSISAAVEEQSAATREIARNVQEAAAGTDEVSRNISGVSEAAHHTSSASQQVYGSAQELNQEAETLRDKVETFLRDIHAA